MQNILKGDDQVLLFLNFCVSELVEVTNIFEFFFNSKICPNKQCRGGCGFDYRTFKLVRL